jgi:hypothetical protein
MLLAAQARAVYMACRPVLHGSLERKVNAIQEYEENHDLMLVKNGASSQAAQTLTGELIDVTPPRYSVPWW